MLANSKSYSDRDLGELALEDARKGGKGRSNAILTLPMEHLRDHYLSMPPEEAAIFEKPCRLEAFIATGAESIRQGCTWDCLGHARARPRLGFPPGRDRFPRALAAWRSRPERIGSRSPQSRRFYPRLPGYFLRGRGAFFDGTEPPGRSFRCTGVRRRTIRHPIFLNREILPWRAAG